MTSATPRTTGRLYFSIRASLAELADAGIAAHPGRVVVLQLLPAIPSVQPAGADRIPVIPYPESLRMLTSLASTKDRNENAATVDTLLPRAAFDCIADSIGAPRIANLSLSSNRAAEDSVLDHLGSCINELLNSAASDDKVLLDDLAFALILHLAQRYGDLSPPPPNARGGLAAWQLRLARDWLEENIAGQSTLDDLAARCGLSCSHFTRAFNVSMGLPPYRWLMYRRIERAKELILQGDMPLARVAQACGFADQSHLTRTFSSLIGTPPARWRSAQEQVCA